MESTFRKLILLIAIGCATHAMRAQDVHKSFFSEKGGIIGGGYGVNSLSLPEGRYVPLFFIAHFGRDIIKPEKLVNRQRFILFFEPQINPVIIQKPNGHTNAAEFGLNVGLQYMYPLSRDLYLYTLISAGPHFITVHTERQAHGFIFSDNMGAGTYWFIRKNIALNTGFRIRHMSNANTRMPNHGINTINYFVGISFLRR